MNTDANKHCYREVNLSQENLEFGDSGGVSVGNRQFEFTPGFFDAATGTVYRSCFSDGRPAPVHVLQGLPSNVVVRRSANGDGDAVKLSIVTGFIRDRQFCTREQAALAGDSQQRSSKRHNPASLAAK